MSAWPNMVINNNWQGWRIGNLRLCEMERLGSVFPCEHETFWLLRLETKIETPRRSSRKKSRLQDVQNRPKMGLRDPWILREQYFLKDHSVTLITLSLLVLFVFFLVCVFLIEYLRLFFFPSLTKILNSWMCSALECTLCSYIRPHWENNNWYCKYWNWRIRSGKDVISMISELIEAVSKYSFVTESHIVSILFFYRDL